MEKWFKEHSGKRKTAKTEHEDKGKGKGKQRTATEQDAKRRCVDSASSGGANMRALTFAIGDLSLDLARNDRLHTSGLLHTWLLPLHERWEEAVQSTTAATGENPIMDYALNWTAMLVAASQAEVTAEAQSQRAVLQRSTAQMQDTTTLLEQIHFCRIARTFDTKYIKIQYWATQVEDLLRALRAVLLALGGELRLGPAPRTAHERAVASLLSACKRA
jgi:hypothetical protein